MWFMIQTLSLIVDGLEPVFTRPSFGTSCKFFLSWIMCLGKHRIQRVAENCDPNVVPDHSKRHGFDKFYNFFERSAWHPKNLAYRVFVLILEHMPVELRIPLLVDDTLAHKRGKSIFGLGWWRDAVASRLKRVSIASGHNWVVIAVAIRLPFMKAPIMALPIMARLHLPGKGQPSCVDLAREMLTEILAWFPNRDFTLIGDGAYASKGLLKTLDARVIFVGRMRGDAALYDPRVPDTKGKRGRKSTKGPRLPSPSEAAAKADNQNASTSEAAAKADSIGAKIFLWLWKPVEVLVYGSVRSLQVLTYETVWPTVFGLRPIQVVVVRDPSGKMDDAYLFTTDLTASPDWVITMFAWRWAIEVVFRSSKQVMDLEAPQHWCQESVEKLAPWVWSMQSVIMVWYYAYGKDSEEAKEMQSRQGPWDSEWSLRHMMQVLRCTILNQTINPNSEDTAELQQMVITLKNWVNLAA